MRVKVPKCAICASPMMRSYIRPVMPDHKQRLSPVGWWCPICCNFKNDLVEIPGG